MTTTDSPQPAPENEETEALPPPEARPAVEWAEKAEKAQEARALGLKLRKGKPVTFRSRRHLSP
jgi:hypothetical protein